MSISKEQILQQFTSAWAKPSVPDITEFVRRLPSPVDANLMNQLITMDIQFCNQRQLPLAAETYTHLSPDALAFAETAVAAKFQKNRRIGFITLGFAVAFGIVTLVAHWFGFDGAVNVFGFLSFGAALLCVSPLKGERFNETGKPVFSKVTIGQAAGCLATSQILHDCSDGEFGLDFGFDFDVD